MVQSVIITTKGDRSMTDREMAHALAQAVHNHGGCAYYVGGCVRDSLTAEPHGKIDLDIEIHGIAPSVLEDILDTYFVSVSDYYEAKNSQATSECYLEFCSDDMDDVKGLRTIIGRHVCNVEKTVNGKKFIALEIE